MRRRLCFLFVSGLLPLFGWSGAWTDRKEYDLVLTIRSEATPQRRLDLLDAWSKAYPKTDLREARQELYLATYQALGDRTRMFETARQLLADQPNSAVGLYWCTLLLPEVENPSPEMLEAGEKASRRLLSGLNSYFSAERKPAGVADADWQKQKPAVEVFAHRTLGWAHWQRGEFPAAEEEFMDCLHRDPSNAEVSAWLGIVLALDKDKQVPALWHLAHALSVKDAGTLQEGERRQVAAMYQQVYASYHGGADGSDELKTAAAASAFPPSEFIIDSATIVSARKAEAELSLTNPELAAWLAIRRQLEADGGDKYFAASMEAKPLPKLKGTVLRSTPVRNARELVLAMNDSGNADIILKLNAALPRAFAPGSKITFVGTGVSFAKQPFQIVALANPGDVQVLTAK